MNDTKKKSIIIKWKEKEPAEKLAVYRNTVAVQAVILAVLWVLCLAFSFDADVGYLRAGALLPAVSTAFLAIGVLWGATPLYFLQKDSLPKELPACGTVCYFISVFAGFLSSFECVYRVISAVRDAETCLAYFQRNLPNYAEYRSQRLAYITDVLIIFFCAGTAAALFLSASSGKKGGARAVFALFPPVRMILGIFQIFFDITVAVNSPLKRICELALMSLVLFFLAEARFRLVEDRARPHWYLASGFVAALMTASSGFSLVFFYFRYNAQFAETKMAAPYGEICLEGFFCLVMFLYVSSRMLAYIRSVLRPGAAAKGIDEEDIAESSETEEANGAGEESGTSETSGTAGTNDSADAGEESGTSETSATSETSETSRTEKGEEQ